MGVSLLDSYAAAPNKIGLFRDRFDEAVETVAQLLEQNAISKRDASILLEIAFRACIKKEFRKELGSLVFSPISSRSAAMDYVKYAL